MYACANFRKCLTLMILSWGIMKQHVGLRVSKLEETRAGKDPACSTCDRAMRNYGELVLLLRSLTGTRAMILM